MLPKLSMKYMNKWGKVLGLALIFSSILILQSCDDEENTPDVSAIEVNLETHRFDKALYALDTNNITTSLTNLKGQYPEFLDFYLDTLMGFPIRNDYSENNPAITKGLLTFLTHKDYRGLYDTIQVHYPNTDEIDEELTKGFKYLKHYFPEYQVPKVMYLSAGLSRIGAFTYGSDVVGVALDMFLGADYPYYKSVGVADYMKVKLDEGYIPVAVFQAIYRDFHPVRMEQSTLLELMIQSGKEMYYTHKVLPFLDEHYIFGYTQDQMQWCKDNEAMVYNFFVQQKLLYDNTMQKVVRYVMDGPSATGMPDQSPGSVGSYIGYRIVEEYMKKNQDVTLIDLLSKEVPAQQMLQESKYKPK